MAEVIPLFRSPRRAGLSSLAMALFLGSWALSFVALFIAWAALRLRAPVWPPPGSPDLPVLWPTVNGIVVVCSSAAAHLCVDAVRRAKRREAMRALGAALTLGVLFLVLQCVSWVELWHAGLRLHRRAEFEPWDTRVVFAGCFYALTWFHAAHVVAGLGVLGAQLPSMRRGRVTPGDYQPLRLATWFWHFVAVMWFCVWPVAYIL
jgi:cytochrome c oxidase subunit 3